MGTPLTEEHKAKLAAGREAARAARAAANPEMPTDEELGIGVEDAPHEPAGTDPLAALLANPAIAEMIDRAVAARIGQAAPLTAAAATLSPSAEMGALAKMFEKLLQVQAMQMPGYFKPLPSEEVERRAAGQVEMRTAIAEARAAGTPPTYYVGENKFYGGSILYEPGEPVATYLPPVEDFTPCHEGPAGRVGGPLAERILAASLVWIGGPSPGIADRVKEAEELAHNPLGGIPLVGETAAIAQGPVERLDIAPREIKQRAPFANMGETVMPGIHGLSFPQAKTGPKVGAQAPRGPAIVE